MVRNLERRTALADAGLRILAEIGARGLTHRAVDAAAGVPQGTTSNYFRTRDELLEALGERIFERLAPASMTPDPALPPTRQSLRHYVRDIVARIDRQPLLELRLEATRRPALAAVLERTLRRNYQADIAFHTAAGLPGGAHEIMLLHFAIDGLMLDRLTVGIGPDDQEQIGRIVDDLASRLVPDGA